MFSLHYRELIFFLNSQQDQNGNRQYKKQIVYCYVGKNKKCNKRSKIKKILNVSMKLILILFKKERLHNYRIYKNNYKIDVFCVEIDE